MMAGVLTQPSETPSAPPVTVPDSAAPPTKGQMDPILTKVRADVESKLPPELKDSVQQVVVAGMKLLYDPSTHPQVMQIYDAIAKGGFQPTAIATGMVNLLGMLSKGSRGKMPVPAAYPAGIILLTYVLDDLTHRGLKVTPELVKDVGQQMTTLFIKAFGIKNGAQPTAPPAPSPSAPPPTQPPAAAPAGV